MLSCIRKIIYIINIGLFPFIFLMRITKHKEDNTLTLFIKDGIQLSKKAINYFTSERFWNPKYHIVSEYYHHCKKYSYFSLVNARKHNSNQFLLEIRNLIMNIKCPSITSILNKFLEKEKDFLSYHKFLSSSCYIIFS